MIYPYLLAIKKKIKSRQRCIVINKKIRQYVYRYNLKKRGQVGRYYSTVHYMLCGSLLYIRVLNLNAMIGRYHCIRKTILNGDD